MKNSRNEISNCTKILYPKGTNVMDILKDSPYEVTFFAYNPATNTPLMLGDLLRASDQLKDVEDLIALEKDTYRVARYIKSIDSLEVKQ